MVYFIIAETINSRRKLNSILGVMFSSIALITIDGVFQLMTGTDFIRHYQAPWHRIRSSFGSSNSFAGWLVVMIPLMLSLAWPGKRDWLNLSGKYERFKKIAKPALWILIGLSMICLSLTYSRGAWIASVLSLIFLGIFKGEKLPAIIIIVLFN